MSTSLKKILATASWIAGIAFGLLGILLIPQGVIDSSVLIYCGQLFVLCAGLLGLDFNFDFGKKQFEAHTENKEEDNDKDIQ